MLLASTTETSESSVESILDFLLWDMPIFYGLLIVATLVGLIVLTSFARSYSKGNKNEETKTSTSLSIIKFLFYLLLIIVIGVMALYFGVYLLIF